MTTAAFAAVSPIGEKLRCEHTESRNRISIRGSFLTDRNVVTIHDFIEHWIASGKPVAKRDVDAVRPKRNSLHLEDVFVEGLLLDACPTFRDPSVS